MKGMFAKKGNMTQVFVGDAKIVPVTALHVPVNTVYGVRTTERDGYTAVVVGIGTKRAPSNLERSRWKQVQAGIPRKVGEFRVAEGVNISVGQEIDFSQFSVGEMVQVQAKSKGKGFQGVVKRHGFAGQKKTHGNKDQLRASGSISAGGVQHVFKGTRMAGRMGGTPVTVKNLEIVKIDEAERIVYVKGAVPGARNGTVILFGAGDVRALTPAAPVVSSTSEGAEEATATPNTPEAIAE